MTDEELKRLLDAYQQRFDDKVDRLVDQVTRDGRHFYEVATEASRHQIGIIAEKVTRVDERLDDIERRMERGFEEVEGQMARGFIETQAMIKFSHAELDRRVRTLEENQRTLEQGLNELQTRIERLEGSTH